MALLAEADATGFRCAKGKSSSESLSAAAAAAAAEAAAAEGAFTAGNSAGLSAGAVGGTCAAIGVNPAAGAEERGVTEDFWLAAAAAEFGSLAADAGAAVVLGAMFAAAAGLADGAGAGSAALSPAFELSAGGCVGEGTVAAFAAASGASPAGATCCCAGTGAAGGLSCMGVAAKTASSTDGGFSMVAMTNVSRYTTYLCNGSKDVMTSKQRRSGRAAYDASLMQSKCTAWAAWQVGTSTLQTVRDGPIQMGLLPSRN